ncbi:hypothetical protein EGR_02115 [Echinococcus granulosus]|uniref:Uncharacterized protein n=1 Tax=Echinococcus granulosus TaxID=6210 RepID=W6UQN2_ECHGR|nr:hypothetical protein EGR_02115 [Echinococcus granulosus]EUB63021.1 hypothetical protein EGR_02115 [Echinococcus granulosus]
MCVLASASRLLALFAYYQAINAGHLHLFYFKILIVLSEIQVLKQCFWLIMSFLYLNNGKFRIMFFNSVLLPKNAGIEKTLLKRIHDNYKIMNHLPQVINLFISIILLPRFTVHLFAIIRTEFSTNFSPVISEKFCDLRQLFIKLWVVHSRNQVWLVKIMLAECLNKIAKARCLVSNLNFLVYKIF